MPKPRVDHAGVGHLRRHQRGEAGLPDRDVAVVDHGGIGIARLVEHDLAAGHEALHRLVGHADGGDHQAVGVDLGAFVEGDAGLVDQHDLAVGVDVAGDLRGIRTDYAVQRDGGGGRLVEVDALLAADVEALPVDGRALAGLIEEPSGLLA